jgi:hypothetical protein
MGPSGRDERRCVLISHHHQDERQRNNGECGKGKSRDDGEGEKKAAAALTLQLSFSLHAARDTVNGVTSQMHLAISLDIIIALPPSIPSSPGPAA